MDVPAQGWAMLCTRCGTESTTGRKFCAACGSPLPRSCPKCGAENAPSSAFCEDCGAALAASASPAASQSTPVPSMTSELRLTSEQPDTATTPEGERKTVTALFADIKGSTELMADLDPEEARAIIDPALQLMIDAVHRYDGYIVQSTGDGIFALFGAPVAHEDHPQRALYAALRMQEELRRYAATAQRARAECRSKRASGPTPARWWCARSTPTADIPNTRRSATPPTWPRGCRWSRRPGSIAISEATRKLVEGYFQLKALGPTHGQGRQRAGERLRGDRARSAAHAVAARGRARA